MDQVVVPSKRNVTRLLVVAEVVVEVVEVIVVISQGLKYKKVVTTELERDQWKLKSEVTKQKSVGVIC